MLSLFPLTQNPSDKSYYKYAITLDKKEFQLGTILEDGEEVSIVGSVFATNGEALIDGNYDGYVSYVATGGTMILKTPSLLVYGDPVIGSLSGTSDKFMVKGKSEGEV